MILLQIIPARRCLLLVASLCLVATGTVPAASGLWLDSDGARELRAKIEQAPFAARWKELLANADFFVANTRNRAGGNERSSFRYSMGLSGVCSLAYLVTGERSYGECAKEEVFRLLQMPAWRVQRDYNKGADLNSAEASIACVMFFDWASDLLGESERTEFQQRLLALGVRPYLESVEHYHDWWVDNPVSNWCGVCHGGSGLAALLLRDFSPEAARAWDHARRHVPAFLDHVVGADGDGHEGVMYWRYGVEFSLFLATAARRVAPDAGIEGVFPLLNQRMAGYWDRAMQAPDGRFANINNMNEGTFAGMYADDPRNFEGGPDAALCALFERTAATATGRTDRLLLWNADHGGSRVYFRGTSPFWFLWRRPVSPAGPKPALPDALLFRTSGHSIWNSPDEWLFFNGGWISDRSHSNADLGSFILVVGGERFVIDPGYGKIHTPEHATISLDGGDQVKGTRGTYLAWMQGDGWRYLATDLSGCYGDRLSRLQRHLVQLDGRILVFVDDVAAADGARIEWNLPTRFPIRLSGASATLEGTRSDLHVVSAGDDTTLQVAQRESGDCLVITPTNWTGRTLLTTVLVPLEKDAADPDVALTGDADDRLLTISAAGRQFTVRLVHRADDTWSVAAVNGATLQERTVPHERTFSRLD